MDYRSKFLDFAINDWNYYSIDDYIEHSTYSQRLQDFTKFCNIQNLSIKNILELSKKLKMLDIL